MVVACLSCLQLPFGTALGVFTLIVLLRPGAKLLFGEAQPTVGEGQATPAGGWR